MRRRTLATLIACVLLTAAAAAAAVLYPGRLARHQTVNGRVLRPSASLVALGHFPTGGALTPDGKLYFTVSAGRGFNDVRSVRLDGKRPRLGKVLPLPGASGGIALDPARRLAYVSGLSDSSNADEKRPGLLGGKGDVVHVLSYDAAGRMKELKVLGVPPPSDSPQPQNFPPTNVSERRSYPTGVAVSADGRTLLVALNLADAAAIVDTQTGVARYVKTGRLPYGAAILPGGKTGLVTNETAGTMSVIDLAAGTKTKDIQIGSHLSHAEEITLDNRHGRAFVPLANTDQVAVVDTAKLALARAISVERPAGRGVSPVATALSRSGSTLYVAEASADEIAVVPLTGARAFQVTGRIPTAAYPADVQLSAKRVVWLAAKGFGSGANPNGPNPYDTGDNNLLLHPGSAVLSRGYAGVQAIPTSRRLRTLTKVADRDLRPVAPDRRPSDTPLRAGGPIKHVFYVVRENRTYDQVLGDVTRGDGDKALTIFGGRVTPNLHQLVGRFPLLDHVYANSEASIDGHFWTSAAAVSDYVHKAWQQNYAGRGRPYDFGVYAATWPGNGFLFDQADRQGISYFNFGEAIAGNVPTNVPGLGRVVNDADRSNADEQRVLAKFAKSDVGAPVGCYDNDASIGSNVITMAEAFDSTAPKGAKPGAGSRFDCFRTKFNSWVSTGSTPSFVYMVLPSDHTEGTTPGRRSPRAMVAENDYGLGQVVDLISHSKLWGSSAIFTLEDDAQDGPDHVDAHRMPVGVFSPYAKAGAVVHSRYDMLSMIRSVELIIGMKPLGLADAQAAPMYAAFSAKPENIAPYSVVQPTYPIDERNSATAANARLSKSLRLNRTDSVPERVLDRILWQSVHGARSTPPPPGPNAVGSGAGDADG
jgi:hypothetical protein